MSGGTRTDTHVAPVCDFVIVAITAPIGRIRRGVSFGAVHVERLTNRMGGRAALRFWLWLVVAWIVIVTLLLAFGGHAGVPSPSDLGWTD